MYYLTFRVTFSPLKKKHLALVNFAELVFRSILSFKN
jgi:hypothetical protein